MHAARVAGLFLTLIASYPTILGAESPQAGLPVRENFHLFLLAGQSNMAGRGEVAEEDKTIHPGVFALSKEGTWKPAVDPIHYDKPIAGVGIGRSFAIALAEGNRTISIGLIPAACGGSPISTWQPGGYHDQTKSHPYDDALQRTRRAMEDGVLKGILWHQGESDSNPRDAAMYQERLTALIKRFRQDLNAPEIPFVIGQLGQFPGSPRDEARGLVDASQRAVAQALPYVAFVPSTGLASKPDNIHFDTPSLREFGRRYAEACRTLQKSNRPLRDDGE